MVCSKTCPSQVRSKFSNHKGSVFGRRQQVKRPKVDSYEGKTPALGDAQARQLLEAPPSDTLKGKRDRAILSVLLFHALRREELTQLLVKDFNHERRGVPHLRVHGKGGKLRYIPAHPNTLRLVGEYLAMAGHGADLTPMAS